MDYYINWGLCNLPTFKLPVSVFCSILILLKIVKWFDDFLLQSDSDNNSKHLTTRPFSRDKEVRRYVWLFTARLNKTRVILFLHTDVSVRACTSCRPLLITSKEKGVVAELLDTVTKHRFV